MQRMIQFYHTAHSALINKQELLPCSGHYERTMGLLCTHSISKHIVDQTPIQLKSIHRRWWLCNPSNLVLMAQAIGSKQALAGNSEQIQDHNRAFLAPYNALASGSQSPAPAMIREPPSSRNSTRATAMPHTVASQVIRSQSASNTRRNPSAWGSVLPAGPALQRCSHCRQSGHN